MLKKLIIVNTFLLTYAIPVFAAPITREEGAKILAKGFLAILFIIGIWLIIIITILFIIWKIIASIWVKTWFKEKEKHEAKKETKPKAPNTTEKPKYEPIDFRAKK